MGVTETIEPLITPAVEAQGVALYDLEFVKEGGNRILRLYIDTDGGVSLDDCERVSRAVEAVLDVHDPIPQAYMLEVSSPGIERKLSRDAHFTRYMGHKVVIKLFAPYSADNNRKKFTGTLTSYENNQILLSDENNEQWLFEKNQVAMCRLIVF
jgi:ribosome maturation factor RimP